MSYYADYTSPIDPATLLAADITGVCRYLSWPRWWAGQNHNYDNPKIIQKTEYDRLTNNGIQVILNWEYDAQDWLGGRQGAGNAHGVQAVSMAKALGYPAGSVIVGSADFDMTRNQWDSDGKTYWIEFRDTIQAGGYTAGAYGPYDVLEWVSGVGGCALYWQAGMSYGWSGGRNKNVHPNTHLFQAWHQTVGGQDVDINKIIASISGGVPDMQQDETMTSSRSGPHSVGDVMLRTLDDIDLDIKPAIMRIDDALKTGITGLNDAQFAELKASVLAKVPTADDLVNALIAKLPPKTV